MISCNVHMHNVLNRDEFSKWTRIVACDSILNMSHDTHTHTHCSPCLYNAWRVACYSGTSMMSGVTYSEWRMPRECLGALRLFTLTCSGV